VTAGAALRVYQQKQGIPVSGTVDEKPPKQLQVRLPRALAGSGEEAKCPCGVASWPGHPSHQTRRRPKMSGRGLDGLS
jgi:hypothetical protein